MSDRRFQFGPYRLMTLEESDELFDAAERQAESQARGPKATSEWAPPLHRFVDLEPFEEAAWSAMDGSEGERENERLREAGRE